ncbi:GYD domain-containing protein [Halopenitus sp. H-Gu1]|uniref:GYD domain-containing protein n=1 Tax=Halopenitus sp. H-Gu1 TaxID=3242697 RepID=UPI00359CE13A
MPTYIVLQEYTQQGIKNIEDSPDRLDDAKELAESMDCEVKQFYLTFGEYDLVVVLEAPDDETAAQLALTVGKSGAVATETLKAFPEDEYREVIAGLP